MTYSIDFRRKVLSVRERDGLTIIEVASLFGIGVATVTRWLRNIERKPSGFRVRKVDIDALRRDVEKYPDAYQYERARRFNVHRNAICHGLKKLGVSYKKNTTPSASRRTRTAYIPSKD